MAVLLSSPAWLCSLRGRAPSGCVCVCVRAYVRVCVCVCGPASSSETWESWRMTCSTWQHAAPVAGCDWHTRRSGGLKPFSATPESAKSESASEILLVHLIVRTCTIRCNKVILILTMRVHEYKSKILMLGSSRATNLNIAAEEDSTS